MHTREAIAGEWMERVLRTYPAETAAFLASEQDPFRNPVGHTLRQGLAILLDELLLAMDRPRVTAALDSILQIRAVQDFTPGQALEFLFQLKPIVAEFAPRADSEQIGALIDEMVLMGFDLYVKYRERMFEARSNAVKRRVYVLEQRMAREAQ